MLCPECGSRNRPSARRCGWCGARLGRAERQSEGVGPGRADLWGPVLVALASGFFVWTTIVQITGQQLIGAALGVVAASAMLRLGLARHTHHHPAGGDQRGAHTG